LKKVLLLLSLTASLVLTTATTSFAMTAYAEGAYGIAKTEYNAVNDGNFGNLYVGLDCSLVSDIKLKLEGFTGVNKTKYNGNISQIGFEAKGGYRIFDSNGVMLTPTLGFLYEEFKNNTPAVYTGLMLGADASCEVSKSDMIEGSLGFSVYGRAKYNQNNCNAGLFVAKVRWIHSFSDAIDGTIGFRHYYAGGSADENNNEKKNTFTLSGLTLGMRYNF